MANVIIWDELKIFYFYIDYVMINQT